MPNLANFGCNNSNKPKAKMKILSLRLKMGGSESKSINGDRPPEDDQYHTPVSNRRVKKLIDPRSPTDDIQRTPLQRTIDDDGSDFQDPRSPTVTIARTPVPDDSDPRSPSAGREPGPFVFPTISADPRSPSRTVARTPITKDAPIESNTETVTVHQSDIQDEPCDTTSNNNQDNNVISKSASDVEEDSEPGVFQIDSEKENLVEEGESPSFQTEETQKNEVVDSNTPEYEMELTNMVEKQTLANEETEDQDQATLVLSDREMIFLAETPPSLSSKAQKHKIRLSLKEKFTSTSQRSPLATRNLLEDSPDPTHRAKIRQQGSSARSMGVAYQKTGVRQRLTEGNQYTVQTVGRYQPVPDKENY